VVYKILLIENDEGNVQRIQSALASSGIGSFDLERVGQLEDGIQRLKQKDIAVILLSLSLPDSDGIETLKKLFASSSNIPVLVLGEDAQEALAREAVELGAQDYILPAHLDGYSLPRALQNAIDRKNIEDALYVEKERALVTLDSIGDAVLCVDLAGCITYLNLVAEKITGWSGKEAVNLPLKQVFQILDGVTHEPAENPLDRAMKENRAVGLTANCLLVRRDGTRTPIEDSAAPIHGRSGGVIGAVIVFHDVSVARAMTLEMTHAAHHDAVTGLPNRLLLTDRINQAVSLAHRQGRLFAVLFLDLDRFKSINDSFGHNIGDRLLQSVSQRLLRNVRDSDTVSRQGGDEFVLLLHELTTAEDAAKSAQKLLLALARPHVIEGLTLEIGASIGIAVYPRDGDNADTLIHNADTAMYEAKEAGRNTFHFFSAEMELKALRQSSIEFDLRRALNHEEFVLHYHPKVSLTTGAILGVEALIRWQPPEQDLILPLQFIETAERCGLIVPIGRWVLREACLQACRWQSENFPFLTMAVNVSSIEFESRNFVAGVRDILAETGLAPQYLQLELTESVLMKHAEEAVSVLSDLRNMGVQIAIDDFGTGYSSLSYLRQFPISVLKIDQSFVRQITQQPDDCILVSAIIGIGHSLRHTVVAEGVETLEQIEYLRTKCCDEAQGYLFSRPLTAEAMTALLNSGITDLHTSPHSWSDASRARPGVRAIHI
jgi:diguanylate cyclase (GGDEF)-like protein/PAS domain S-box-containing protein